MPPASRSAEAQCGRRSLRRWMLQAQVDVAQRPDVTTAEQQRIRKLEWESRDHKEANEILNDASIFSGGSRLGG